MLQHVSIEIAPDQAEAAVEFWRLLGFERVDSPEALGGYVTWLERAGTQVHLIHTEEASVPVLGHAAVVVDDFEDALSRVSAAGHDITEARASSGRPAGVHDLAGGPPGRADGGAAARVGQGLRSGTSGPTFCWTALRVLWIAPAGAPCCTGVGWRVLWLRRGRLRRVGTGL